MKSFDGWVPDIYDHNLMIMHTWHISLLCMDIILWRIWQNWIYINVWCICEFQPFYLFILICGGRDWGV